VRRIVATGTIAGAPPPTPPHKGEGRYGGCADWPIVAGRQILESWTPDFVASSHAMVMPEIEPQSAALKARLQAFKRLLKGPRKQL
jgi:hypothetical protein